MIKGFFLHIRIGVDQRYWLEFDSFRIESEVVFEEFPHRHGRNEI